MEAACRTRQRNGVVRAIHRTGHAGFGTRSYDATRRSVTVSLWLVVTEGPCNPDFHRYHWRDGPPHD